MIEISGLEKKFGSRPVLSGIDVHLRSGRVTAVVGPNGTGKTTLIKCVLGLTHPDRGTVRVDGHRLNGDWMYRRHIGYMPQYAHYPENLSAREVFRLVKDLRDNPVDLDEELLEAFELGDELDKPFRALSGGTRQKVSAVIAFLFQPRILFLDEPTAGLDPVSSSVLKDKIVKTRDAGRTVVLTSHIMTEIEELADHLVFLLNGRVWFEGDTEAVKRDTGETRLERAVAQLMRNGSSHLGSPHQNEKASIKDKKHHFAAHTLNSLLG